MNEEVLRIMKKQVRFTKITMMIQVGIFLLLGVCVITILPKLSGLLNIAQTTLDQTNTTMIVAENAIKGIESTMAEVDSLVIESQESLSSAAIKIEEFDIETLNEAIKELEAVVKPMAKLMGYKN